jgi:hypothetical protein
MMDDPLGSRISLALATAETETPGLAGWLAQHGHAELAACPTCHRGDFLHERDCIMGEAIDMLRALQSRAARDRATAQKRGHRPRTQN